MKQLLFCLLTTVCVCLFSSCSKDIDSWSDAMSGGNAIGGGNSSSGTFTGSLLSFAIDLDDVEDTNYSNLEINTANETYGEDYDTTGFTTEVSIVFSGTTATVSGLNAADTLASTVGSSNVVLRLGSSNLKINVSGQTSAGSLKIYSQKKFALALNGIEMTSSLGSCINIQSSKRAYLMLSGSNSLTDAYSYSTAEGEDEKGCIFGEGKLIFCGNGSLTLAGNTQHAIAGDDYVHIYGGNIVVNNAAKDAVHANDAFFMEGGSLTVDNAGSNGVECEEGSIVINGGILTVNSVNDAVSASYEGTDTSVSPSVTVGGGLLKLTTTGEKAMGLKSEGVYTQTGGLVKISVSGAGSKGISSGGNTMISGGIVTAITTGAPYIDTSSSTTDVKGAAGIKSDGTFTLSNATLRLKSSGTGGKGISCDGDIIINSGSIVDVITTGTAYGSSSGNGGWNSPNSSNDTSSSPKGIRSEGNLTINGGTLRVLATGGENSEGIESKKVLTINGGTVLVATYDDAINAATQININGGNIYCYASNNDGIDSNGTINITGGLTVSSGTTSPEEGIDSDSNAFKVTGGTFIGVGGATSTPTSVSQSVLKYSGSGSSGAIFTVASSDGTVVGSYVIPRAYSQMTVLFSSPALKSGNSYTLYSGGTVTATSSDATFYGLTTAGSISGGTSLNSFTASSSSVTSIGSSNGSIGGGMR